MMRAKAHPFRRGYVCRMPPLLWRKPARNFISGGVLFINISVDIYLKRSAL